MLEARCESIGQHRHGVRFIDDNGRCLACYVEALRSDQSRLLEEIKELATDKQTLTTCIEGLRDQLASACAVVEGLVEAARLARDTFAVGTDAGGYPFERELHAIDAALASAAAWQAGEKGAEHAE